MIPTMLVFGLITGRWWRFALISAAIVWPVLLVTDGVTTSPWVLITAAALGAANAAIGVLAHQLLLRAIRAVTAAWRRWGLPDAPQSG